MVSIERMAQLSNGIIWSNGIEWLNCSFVECCLMVVWFNCDWDGLTLTTQMFCIRLISDVLLILSGCNGAVEDASFIIIIINPVLTFAIEVSSCVFCGLWDTFVGVRVMFPGYNLRTVIINRYRKPQFYLPNCSCSLSCYFLKFIHFLS